MLGPHDPQSSLYSIVVQKLFSEIPVSKEDIWICRVKSTTVVKVYFAGLVIFYVDTKQYPISRCCAKGVYVKFDWDLSGALVCSHCQRALHNFVYLPEDSNASD